MTRGENLKWMPPRCLPDASQVPPRCLPDATKMVPDVSRCLSDASSGDGEGDDDGDLDDASPVMPPQ